MNKLAIVTGGSAGIGLATVKKLLTDGFDVFNLDIKPSEFGEYLDCDLTDFAKVQTAIKQISQYGTITALVCNAGKHLSANIEQTSPADFDALLNLNVKGAFAASQACIPLMKANGGSIVYVASDQAIIGKRNSFAYNLSKHALASMAKTTALDYAEFNIRANAVCPGTIETELYHKAIDNYCAKSGEDKTKVHAEEAALQPLGRLGQPEEVANLIAFLVSDKAAFITGSLHAIDGGYTAQ